MLRCACGSLALPATPCPHCGRAGAVPVTPAALLLLGLAGCVGATTDEKAADHTGTESTTPVEPPYGVPTDFTTTPEPHSAGGSGGGSGTH